MLIFSCRIIHQFLFIFLSLVWILIFSLPIYADIVKPALIEINVNQLGEIEIEARVSIEALLTGINSQYKNTQDAPTAAEYDVLREMQSDELKKEFSAFEKQFLSRISLKSHTSNSDAGSDLILNTSEVKIPEPGYTKVPRISLIKLKSEIGLDQVALTWYYPMAYGDNAVRLRQVDDKKKKYHWSEWQWLRKDQPSKPFSLTEVVAKRPLNQVISDYISLGFQHILPKAMGFYFPKEPDGLTPLPRRGQDSQTP